MREHELADAPLTDSSKDLLDMAPHARTLAGYLDDVQLPFTVGIYGAWGEGKTTFANLIIDCLAAKASWQPLKVINFSAWPYITADRIWRALLDRIAREAFEQSPADDRQSTPVHRPGRRERIRKFLTDDLAKTDTGTIDDQPGKRYEQMRARFDRTAAIANRTGQDNAEFNISALAAVVLDAAATLAPGIGLLGRVLGLGDGSVREMLKGENPLASTAVDSVEELRQDLQEIFRRLTTPTTRRLVVLIDDLDRCLPTVALDVLETVKIFFSESAGAQAPCLFLVAVDEDLVADGLRLRVGEAGGPFLGPGVRSYLEKIVQLRVPVPSPDDGRVHQLVGANSPEWAGVTDLVAVGVGRNPRRIKQQCNLMSYEFKARKTHDDG